MVLLLSFKNYQFLGFVYFTSFNLGMLFPEDKIVAKSCASSNVKFPEIDDFPPLIGPIVTLGAEYTKSFIVIAMHVLFV
ncbi:hypothetical protein [uncultured Algibacter sp.]|uniref:hypothetical protein n=1 Tax=uncultured Algibacter sp. TaxID=298659 RepID=UPI0032170F3E